MVEKFFLALDYDTDDEVIEKARGSVAVLRSEFGEDFVHGQVGVKLNQDAFTGPIDPRYRKEFSDAGIPIFADLKVAHGAGTWERILDKITGEDEGNLPIRYATAAAGLGPTILKKYVSGARERGIAVVAFTAHTKIPTNEALAMYAGSDMDDVIYNLGLAAADGGCDAMVLEGERLKADRIRGLPIKKLVTGIRVDISDLGEQNAGRVTGLEELAEVVGGGHYVVVSSRYLDKPKTLVPYFRALL